MSTGAESLVRAFVAGRGSVCFAKHIGNAFASVLDRMEGMRCVLSLFEGVVSALPTATLGAAVACLIIAFYVWKVTPAAYTLQALWTILREKLNVMTMIRQSQLCHSESRHGQCRRRQVRKALDMLDVGYPDIDWCRLAAGVGVSASRIRTIEEFAG